MPRKKSYKTELLTQEYKKIIVGLLSIFLAVIVVFEWTQSRLWYFIYAILYNTIWDYYKWIFSIIMWMFWFFILFKEDLDFNFYRLMGIFFYFISISTITWWIYTEWIIKWKMYHWMFNLHPTLEWALWWLTTQLLSVLLLIMAFALMFKLSIRQILRFIAWKWLSSVGSMKDSMMWVYCDDPKPMTKQSKQMKKKMDKKQSELDKMMIRIEKEKEALSREKELLKTKKEAPKKIKIEKVKKTNRQEKKSSWLLWWLFWQGEESDAPRKLDYSWWEYPSYDLLEDRWWEISYDENEIMEKEIAIREKLLQFRIEVSMVWFKVWPTVIQFRLQPKDWVKLNKIENLKKDIALALRAKSIRIQAPIPGEWVVWIEVPNDERQLVWLKEIITSKKFNSSRHIIPLAVWKDVSGEIIVWDLTKMPHLLVAWQTASWKSVWMNGFLISLLYNFSPKDLKLILVDPKKVELSIYEWIPHLLTPVITNSDKAVNALKWSVLEMMRRYDMCTGKKSRNIVEYNAKVSESEKLPYIIIVIDELADLMMSGSKKEVEWNISRITQMARAVWMHLIVATQRPSVDVITGLIKANVPSRIAFTVASQVDSRTVIDRAGAEDLLWRGDMLYYPTWAVWAERVQWVFVDVDEIEAIVNQIKLTIDPEMVKQTYDPEIVNWKSDLKWSVMEWYDGDYDEDPKIIEDAIQTVREMWKASTSLLQRRMKLGYARAARVMDILEDLWIVGPADWSKPREVYK